MTGATKASIQEAWLSFVAWILVGAGYGFAAIGAASIGLFILPLPLIATAMLIRRPTTMRSVPGLLAGVGIVALFVAYTNRDGPGDVCASTSTGSSCGQQWNPWPWLIAGAVLIALGIAWFLACRRAGNPGDATEPR